MMMTPTDISVASRGNSIPSRNLNRVIQTSTERQSLEELGPSQALFSICKSSVLVRLWIRRSQKVDAVFSKSKVSDCDCNCTKRSDRDFVCAGIDQPGRVQQLVAGKPCKRQIGAVGKDTEIGDQPRVPIANQTGQNHWPDDAEDRSHPKGD